MRIRAAILTICVFSFALAYVMAQENPSPSVGDEHQLGLVEQVRKLTQAVEELQKRPSIVMLDTPIALKYHSRTDNDWIHGNRVVGVQDTATALVVQVFTYNRWGEDRREDHVTHYLGRKIENEQAGRKAFVYPEYHLNPEFVGTDDHYDLIHHGVVISHRGQGDGQPFYYGHWHGTQVVPLNADGTLSVCLNYSGFTSGIEGTRHMDILVYGYVGVPELIKSVEGSP